MEHVVPDPRREAPPRSSHPARPDHVAESGWEGLWSGRSLARAEHRRRSRAGADWDWCRGIR